MKCPRCGTNVPDLGRKPCYICGYNFQDLVETRNYKYVEEKQDNVDR